MNGQPFPNDFDQDEYAAIGKCCRSFSIIEYELFRTLVVVKGGPEDAQNDDVKASLQGTFTNRYEILVKELKACKKIDKKWLKELNESFKQARELRNFFAHGFWMKSENGKLNGVFYRSLKDCDTVPDDWPDKGLGIYPEEREFTVEKMEELFQRNLHNLKVLQELQEMLET